MVTDDAVRPGSKDDTRDLMDRYVRCAEFRVGVLVGLSIACLVFVVTAALVVLL